MSFHLFSLCMDEESYGSLRQLALPGITALRLREIEQNNPALQRARAGRSRIEYYYTCGPSYMLFLLQHYPEIDVLTYLDADLFFFSSPKPIFDEMEGYSVGIIEHRFSERQQRLKRFGVFNVGWMSFRRDDSGLACLHWWSERCIEWCYDRFDGNRFADQKYLDEFPARFSSVCVIQNKGANLAPWNLANYSVTEQGGRIWVDNELLIFFHFHGFKALSSWLFDTNLGGYQTGVSGIVRRQIFRPYISKLRDVRTSKAAADSLREKYRNESRGHGVAMRSARKAAQLFFGILRRGYIVDFSGKDSVAGN